MPSYCARPGVARFVCQGCRERPARAPNASRRRFQWFETSTLFARATRRYLFDHTPHAVIAHLDEAGHAELVACDRDRNQLVGRPVFWTERSTQSLAPEASRDWSRCACPNSADPRSQPVDMVGRAHAGALRPQTPAVQ
jgi:hypothetical protein